MRTFQFYAIAVAHALRSAYRYAFGPAVEAEVMTMQPRLRFLRAAASVILMINIMTLAPAVLIEIATPLSVPFRFATLAPLMILGFSGLLPGVVRVRYANGTASYAFRPVRAVTRALSFMASLWMVTLVLMVVLDGWHAQTGAQPMEIVADVWNTTLTLTPAFLYLSILTGCWRLTWALLKFVITPPRVATQ